MRARMLVVSLIVELATCVTPFPCTESDLMFLALILFELSVFSCGYAVVGIASWSLCLQVELGR